MAIRTEIVDRLRGLQKEDGRLDPKDVVNDARHPRSPLHDSFEWDDSVAAEQHRLLQARRLIGAVKFEIRIHKVDIPAPIYVKDPDDHVYRTVVAVRSDEDQARAALIAATDRVVAALKRARVLAMALNQEEELGRFEVMLAAYVQRIHDLDTDQPEGNA